MDKAQKAPEMQELSEQIGEFIHYWGFKRVHGRIWTHLFLAERPLDAADLVRQMGISKALVSISLRELLEYQVIVELGKSDHGTNLYAVNQDILQVILNVLRGREKRLLNRIEAAHEALERVPNEGKKQSQISQERLDLLRKLVSDASASLEGLISLRSVDFGEWKNSFSLSDSLVCPPTQGYGSSEKRLPADEVSSARAPNDEITLIGRPLLPNS